MSLKQSEQLLLSLERISDPLDQLVVAFKHDLKSLIREMIDALLRDREYFFSRGEEPGYGVMRPVLFNPENKWQVVHHLPERVALGFHQEARNRTLLIDFAGMVGYFGWSFEEARDFVRPLLERFTTQEPVAQRRRRNAPMTDLARTYLGAGDEVARATERWAMLSYFRNKRIFELRERALLVPQESWEKTEKYHYTAELNPFVERMREVGFTDKQIQEEFLSYIREFGSSNWEFMLPVAGIRCFKKDSAFAKRRDELLRTHYLPFIHRETNIFEAAEEYVAFKEVGIHAWKLGDGEFFRARVVELLASGEVGKAYKWLVSYAHHTDLYPPRLREATRYSRDEDLLKKSALNLLSTMARQAVPIAEEQERFGIAAALVEHFEGVVAAEHQRQLAQLARDLDQPILLKDWPLKSK